MTLHHPERLKGVHPKLVSFVETLAEEMPWDVLVIYGLRTDEEQQALYAKGRTVKGEPPYTPQMPLGRTVTEAEFAKDTAHGCGAAVDVVPLLAGSPDWETRESYEDMAHVAKRLGIGWGGDWTGKAAGDLDHFFLFGWKDAAPTPPPEASNG